MKLMGGEEREEKKATKKVGFDMKGDEEEEEKPKRDSLVRKLFLAFSSQIVLCRRTPTGLRITRKTRENVPF